MKLEKAEIARYSKQLILPDIGVEGQLKLKQARVAVIGAGGLGCPILQYLSAVGVGTLGIIEHDVVAASNLHRQILYSSNDANRKKADVVIEKLSSQNPHINILKHDEAINGKNAVALLSGFDVVVDGCDNFSTRYLVNDTCVALDTPLVYGSILGYEGQIAVFNHKGSKNLRDIFPEPPDAADVPDCSQNGVLGTVPGIIGTIMAQTTVSVILGRQLLENSLIIFNTLTLESVKLFI